MKKLSIEQKAKRYDEAIKLAKDSYNYPSYPGFIRADVVFPELKESEDEKIRKALIRFHKSTIDIDGIKGKNILAWLEKQEGCEYIKKDWLEHIKQSWYKEGFIDGKYSGGTSKEWTINDAAIFKEIIDFLENGTTKLQHDLTKYANWLKIQFTPIEKQGRQFSVDKLEPKFHEGEWIVLIATGSAYQVEKIKNYEYTLRHISGGSVRLSDEKLIREWTIQDAKAGNVLYCKADNGIEYFVMNKGINKCGNIDSYFRYNSLGDFGVDIPSVLSTEDDNITPATKEQRDLLFQKMKEAGYEWDAVNKELKKISQRMISAEAKEAMYDKPACVWSEEDECYMSECIGAIATKDGWSFEEKRKTKKWLQSLKQRIGG